MNIRDFYEGKDAVLERALKQLQSDANRFTPELEPPEVLGDNFLREWLAFNYMFALDFKADGTPIMGETGGIIPAHSKDGKKVLAVSYKSVEKVIYGTASIMGADLKKEPQLVAELETEIGIETPVTRRNGVIVINGNRNVAHYDFTTGAARDNSLDLLTTNAYLLLSAEGVPVLSNKRLRNEQYIFNFPVNPRLFEVLRPVSGAEVLRKLSKDEYNGRRFDVLNRSKGVLVPDGFIAGFHITYRGDKIKVRPVIGERELHVNYGYLRREGLTPQPSDIFYIGTSDAHGRSWVHERKVLH